MCYNKAQTTSLDKLGTYYSARYSDSITEQFEMRYFESGFTFKESPIITAMHPGVLVMSSWGLIPFWRSSYSDAMDVENRRRTLNCQEEEMYNPQKRSWAAPVKQGQRCLIPCTGFFENQHRNGSKLKVPHFIKLKDTDLFSFAGLYSLWKDAETNKVYHTYTICTTVANSLMSTIHNSPEMRKRKNCENGRMPVILPRDHEKDWLNKSLTENDVQALCKPFDQSKMEAWTVSKMINARKVGNKNTPEAQKFFPYEDLTLF